MSTTSSSTSARAWRFRISLREPAQGSLAVLEHIHLLHPPTRITHRDEHARHSVRQEARCHEGSSRFSGEYVLTRQCPYGLVVKSDTRNAPEVHQLGKAGVEAGIGTKFSPVLRNVRAGKPAPCPGDNQVLVFVYSIVPHAIHGRGGRVVSGCTAQIIGFMKIGAGWRGGSKSYERFPASPSQPTNFAKTRIYSICTFGVSK